MPLTIYLTRVLVVVSKFIWLTLSRLICTANQGTGFYMITASVMKGLKMWLNGLELIAKYQRF